MSILFYFLLLVLDLVMVTAGAGYLINDSMTIAERLGVSQLVIGLTIVGFGTSAPELVVSLTSVLANKPDITIANVVSSNIANTLLILGVSAVIYPLRVTYDATRRDIPIAMLITAICLVMASDHLLTGGFSGNIIGRSDGIILLGFLVFHLYLASISAPREKTLEADQPLLEAKSAKPAMLLSIVEIIGGLALLIFGGRLFVDNASSIACLWGINEAIIGLTVATIGTLLPGLATSAVAAVGRQPGLITGNIVGSSIFNILFILGASATITPLAPAGIQLIDYMMMLVAVFLLFIFSNVVGQAMISHKEGVALLIVYVAYVTCFVVETL